MKEHRLFALSREELADMQRAIFTVVAAANALTDKFSVEKESEPPLASKSKHKRHKVSEEGRKAISRAAKKRWAKYNRTHK